MARKSAFVTGATGFVGSNLVKRLVGDGWETHVIVRAGSSLCILSDIKHKIHVHLHDGSTERLIEILKETSPHIVFHLASLFIAQHASRDIDSLIQSNLLFSTQLVEAMSVNGVRYLINTGTSWQHYEDKEYNPVNLYAATKQAFEDILSYYVEAAGLRVITLKLFDTYGPGDQRQKLFAILGQTLRSRKLLSMSPGEQFIDLVYIDDVISAFVGATRVVQEVGVVQQDYGVSSGAPIRLKDFVALYERVVGHDLPIQWGARAYRHREVMVPWTQSSPLPGWWPTVSLEEGIKRVFLGDGGRSS